MTEEKEIQKLAFEIKFIDKYLKLPEKNRGPVSFDYESIAVYLIRDGYKNIYFASKNFFKNANKYVLKWYSLTTKMVSAEYVSGAQEICASAVFEIEKFEKTFKKKLLLDKFPKKKTEEKENENEFMAKIIQSFAAQSSSEEENEAYSESKRITKCLLSFGYSNFNSFLLSFSSQAEKYFEGEWEKIEKERENEERGESYISGKIFLLRRLEEKIGEIKEELEKGKENE